MTVAVYCLIAAALMLVLTKVPLAWAMSKEGRGYDNRNPRQQQARLTGFGARALASHQNMIEAFPVFAAGVLVALLAGATGAWLTGLAIAFVIARVVYSVCYLADVHALRSIAWAVGFAASVGLMVLALL